MFNHLGRMAHILGVLEGMGPNRGDVRLDDGRLRQQVRDDPNPAPGNESEMGAAIDDANRSAALGLRHRHGMHRLSVGPRRSPISLRACARCSARANWGRDADGAAVGYDGVGDRATVPRVGVPARRHDADRHDDARPAERRAGGYRLSHVDGPDGWVQHVMRGRMALDSEPGKLAQMEEAFFRMNLLTRATDINRSVHGRVIAAELGMHARNAWADLNPRFRHALEMNGFTAQKWEMMRSAPMRNVDGKPYTTHDLMLQLDDATVEPLVADRIA